MPRVVSQTDPRYVRSRAKLVAALWRLASEQPVTEISVAQLCRAAGVTRDTFYRHSTSPAELLADLVTDLVAAIAQDAIGQAATQPGVLANGLRQLLTHIGEHTEVYRNGLAPAAGEPLRAVLEESFATTLRQGTEIAPELLAEELRTDPLGIDIAIAYAAAGAAGALRVWLSSPDPHVDRGVRLILAASPASWRVTR